MWIHKNPSSPTTISIFSKCLSRMNRKITMLPCFDVTHTNKLMWKKPSEKQAAHEQKFITSANSQKCNNISRFRLQVHRRLRSRVCGVKYSVRKVKQATVCPYSGQASKIKRSFVATCRTYEG